jgi:hypothetical protein
MQWQLLIPTYNRHFQYNRNFLQSCDKYCIDNLNITFVITEKERQIFNSVINGYKAQVITLHELIKDTLSIDIDEDHLLHKIGKFNFQSLKKIYGALKYDYSIVLDSENLCINKFNSNQLIDNIIEDKNIFYSNKMLDSNMVNVTVNASNLLNCTFDKYFFQTSYWLYEKNIVQDLLNQHNLYEYFLKTSPNFEAVIYSAFINKNNHKYKYNFINTEDIFGKEICDELSSHGFTPEHFCIIANKYIDRYCNWINKYHIPVARMHWISEDNVSYIKKQTNIKIGTFHYD